MSINSFSIRKLYLNSVNLRVPLIPLHETKKIIIKLKNLVKITVFSGQKKRKKDYYSYNVEEIKKPTPKKKE